MKRDTIWALSTVILVCILGLSIGISITEKREKEYWHHEVWVYNWSPSVQQFTFENVTYHCVIVTREVVFVSRNATEAIQWAIDYTGEWGWVWER